MANNHQNRATRGYSRRFRFLSCFLLVLVSDVSAARASRKIVIGVDGGTESVRACCFDASTGKVVGGPCSAPYATYHPHPGWAEQNPNEWYECLGVAVRGAVASARASPNGDVAVDDGSDDSTPPPSAAEEASRSDDICCICVDTTCCSVVALDRNAEPLRNCLLWMDARSSKQTGQIMEACRGDPALRVNCGGEGPLSAEWMTPKALWIRQNEPEVWERAETICEYQDYINLKLTGNLCASSCNAATRWHWDGEECLRESTADDPFPGRPLSLYKKLGIPELASKLPQRCLPMGGSVGGLTDEAARHLNLPAGTPVAQGGPDAFVGMVGLGCTKPGQLCLITGSSHLLCVVSAAPGTAPGMWGAYKGAPLPGLCFAEGGQSSTGSIMRWARNLLGENKHEYKELDDEASKIPPGSDGLVALETFQGSRTPVTDPLSRGALAGLTLSHTRAHIWRALMESVCFGTRACLDGLESAGHPCQEIVIAGGATRSELWLQMHADVTGKPVVVCEFPDAPLLGCAILASVNAGIHKTVDDAVAHMVRRKQRIEPSTDVTATYSEFYDRVYSGLREAVRPIAHATAALASGRGATHARKIVEQTASGGHTGNTIPTISPSLLACDWSDMRGEVQRCIQAGMKRLHVDVFDGVGVDALTFGPQMVEAIRRCSKETTMDLHVCVARPARYVQAMKEAGGDTFIFQWEAVQHEIEPLESALRLAQSIVDSGMDAGVSINPSTNVEDLFPLIRSGLISVVDVLAVEPGFGGQKFQDSAIEKCRRLVKLRDDWQAEQPGTITFEIMVDGGINVETANKVDADILVAGTFLFKHPDSLRKGAAELLEASFSNGNQIL